MYRIVVLPDAVGTVPPGERVPRTVTVQLVGEIDALATTHLALVLADARSDRPQTLVVDLSEVTFLNSSSLAVLQHASLTAEDRGATFRVVGAARALRRLLVWADMQHRLQPAAEAAPHRARQLT